MINGVYNFHKHEDQLRYLREIRSVQGMPAVYEHLAWLAQKYDVAKTRAAIEAAKERR